MTERSEKTIFRGAGRFGIFFGPFQFLLDTSTLNKKPDLTAKRGDQLEQVGIRLDNLMANHLEDPIAARPAKRGKANPPRSCASAAAGARGKFRSTVTS